MLGLELAGGLDAFPSRGDFDEDAVLADALLFVELGVCSMSAGATDKRSLKIITYLDDVKSLVDRRLLVKGVPRINFRRHLPGNNL
jgi:hypothetical protein